MLKSTILEVAQRYNDQFSIWHISGAPHYERIGKGIQEMQ